MFITRVDDVRGSTPGYGSFGSWSQHVVSSENGDIFVAYSYIDDNYHQPNYWRLARSQDGGQTFATVYDGAADGSLACAPAIEIDDYGNVYVIASTNCYGDALTAPTLFYRFNARADYANPQVVSLPIGGPGKFSTVFDRKHNLIHILQWAWWRANTPKPDFYSITTRGLVLRAVDLFKPREAHPHAAPEYPCLAIGADGRIVAAWATMDDKLWGNGAGVQNYYDAHFIASPDGGATWFGPAGKLALPIIGDDTGPAFTISDPTNLADTQPWGTPSYRGNWNIVHNAAYNNGAMHFFYGGPLPYAHVPYVRFNNDGSVAARRSPFFKTDDGYQFSDAGGAFSQDASGAGRLHFVGRYWHAGVPYIGVATSDDGGATWHLLEPGVALAGSVRYIGASRELPADGRLIGVLTANPTNRMDGMGDTGIYFFRVG